MRFSRFPFWCAALALGACSSTDVPEGYPDDDRVVEDLEARIAESLGPDVGVEVTQFRFVSEWSKDDYVGYRIVFGLDADADINKTLPTTGEVFLMKEGDEALGCEATVVYDRERTSDPWKLRGVLFTKPMCKSPVD
jgi:hypothetical protein